MAGLQVRYETESASEIARACAGPQQSKRIVLAPILTHRSGEGVAVEKINWESSSYIEDM